MIEVGDRVRINSPKTQKWHNLEGECVRTRYDHAHETMFPVQVRVFGGSSMWFADRECILLGPAKVEKTSDNYPEGSIAIYGNPANGQSVTRQANGTWTFNAGSIRGQVASYDDIMRGCMVIHNPGIHK